MKKIVATMILLLLLISGYPLVVSASSEEPAIDVMFIMDLSGSMRTADPEKVSLSSVAVFADLLGDSSSQVGFVTFSDDVLQSMPLTPVEQARSRIRNNLLPSEFGGWTNIPAALDTALNLLAQSSSSNQKIAILFTDGNVDLPPNSGMTNRQGEDKCRELAEAYKDAGIPIYTVGLNYDGSLDLKFIQDLSDLSSPLGRGAKSYEAKTNWDIPEIFSKIYINIFNGNADVGLQFDSVDRTQTALFTADEGIYELNILLMHTNRLDNLAISHNGQPFNGASFQQRDGYSFVKIRYPYVGDWEFTFQGDFITANKQVRYITNTNVNVTITFDTDGGSVLDPIKIQIGKTLPDIPNPTKEKFSFEGWYLNEARTQGVSGGRTFSRDTLLYAKWVPQILRDITFIGDGLSAQTSKLPDGDRFYNHLPLPARKGYAFVGWFLDDETKLDENTMISQNLTLTAHWEQLKINLFPSILFFILAAGVFAAGMIFGKKLFEDSSEKSMRLCAGISAIFGLLFTLACWSFLRAYLIPVELLSSSPTRSVVASTTFAESLDLFALYGGFLVPFVLNVLLASVLPMFFVSPAARFGKEKQYLIHLLATVVGFIWPIILGVTYGAGVTMLWLLAFAFVAYTLNFFISALLFRQGNSQTCSQFFFDF